MNLLILIVDDDMAVRFFHQIIVEQSRLSNKPLAFTNGKEVLDYLDESFDENNTYLMLLDINMPVMNSWELLKELKDKSYYNHVHILLVTSSVHQSDKDQAKCYQMVIDIVEKPVTDEICEKIIHFFSPTQLAIDQV